MVYVVDVASAFWVQSGTHPPTPLSFLGTNKASGFRWPAPCRNSLVPTRNLAGLTEALQVFQGDLSGPGIGSVETHHRVGGSF